MDNKNNVELISLDTKHGGNIRGSFGTTGHLYRGYYIYNNNNTSSQQPKMLFKTEEGKFLVNSNSPDEYKNICSGKQGNYVFNMSYDNTKRNFSHCKWKYDKEKRTLINEQFPDYCLGNWDAQGWWSLRGCDDGDVVRWVWGDDWETCKSLGLSLQDCKLSKITDAKKDCKKYTNSEICNINDIQKIKSECNSIGVPDEDCNKSLLDTIKSYFSNDLTNKKYSLYKDCINKNISSTECSQTLLDKCNNYNFNSPGNIKACNLKTVDSHEKSCIDAGLDLSICTVDELTNELNRQVISQGQKNATDIAILSLEENKKQSKEFLNQVSGILNGETISSSSSNIIQNSKNLDNNTVLLIGVGLLVTYLILSQ